jgi:hypothetical protein
MISRGKWTRTALAAWVVAAACIVACYPSPDLGIEDYDTVVTVVAEGADFSGFSTYFMPDTVLQRPGEGGISRAFDDLILSDINRNMQQLGYVFEPDPANNPPDLVVVAGTITEDQYRAYIGYPFFGAALTGQIVYPTVGVRYWYTLGSITIDIAKGADVSADTEDFPMQWTASISGPLVQSLEKRPDRITNGINRAFAQSPYLKPE